MIVSILSAFKLIWSNLCSEGVPSVCCQHWILCASVPNTGNKCWLYQYCTGVPSIVIHSFAGCRHWILYALLPVTGTGLETRYYYNYYQTAFVYILTECVQKIKLPNRGHKRLTNSIRSPVSSAGRRTPGSSQRKRERQTKREVKMYSPFGFTTPTPAKSTPVQTPVHSIRMGTKPCKRLTILPIKCLIYICC